MLWLTTETADMTSRRKLWLSSIVVYALFVSWYTDFGGPLTEAEIQAYISKTESLDLGGDPSARGALLEFLRNDTGGQFLMFNAVDLAKNPPPIEGAPPDADGQTLIDLYMEHMVPALLSRASHPVVVGKSVADSLDLLGIEGAEAWSDGAIALRPPRQQGDPLAVARDGGALAPPPRTRGRGASVGSGFRRRGWRGRCTSRTTR